jgi:hypothetical protein
MPKMDNVSKSNKALITSMGFHRIWLILLLLPLFRSTSLGRTASLGWQYLGNK